MIQLQVLSGRKAGAVFHPVTFPCGLGRAADCHMVLDDDGIWERHLEFEIHREAGIAVRLFSPALATVNGHPFEHVFLRSGDLIEAGGVRLRFSLSDPVQGSLRLRETLTWISLGLLCLVQLGVIYELIS